nr:MAG: replication associated protein [Cressdnaviricota sp.]
MADKSRGRNWCFTYNNYPDTVLVDTVECDYIAYSHEVAPTSGTPHLQGYIHWDNPLRFTSVKTRLPGCHIELMRGRFDQNEAYCSKAGKLIERGTAPVHNDNNGANEITRWQGYYDSAIQGKMDDIHPKVRIQYYATLKRIRNDHCPKPVNLPSVCGIWIYGPPETGKTKRVCEKYPEHYSKMGNKWWDDYNGEPVVFLDEFDSCHIKECLSLLKHWADFKAFRCENKGASIYIRPEKFIICSNHHLNELVSTGDVIYSAVARRFKFIHSSQNICSLI